MLDIKRIREDFEGVKERVEFRGKGDFGIEECADAITACLFCHSERSEES